MFQRSAVDFQRSVVDYGILLIFIYKTKKNFKTNEDCIPESLRLKIKK